MRTPVVLTAILAAATPSFAQPAGTAAFEQPPPPPPCSGCLYAPPDTIYLNASGGRVAFPVPSSQRIFASQAEFATFIQQNLNATPIYHTNGMIIGMTGGVHQIGETYYVDSTNNVRPITDPIGGFLGGLPAMFTVAGDTYETGVQGTDYLYPQRTMSAPTDTYQCNISGECLEQSLDFEHQRRGGHRGQAGDWWIPGVPILLPVVPPYMH
jgi:hypothetical protein